MAELSLQYYAFQMRFFIPLIMGFSHRTTPLADSNYFYVADGYGSRALAWMVSRLTNKTTIVNNAAVERISLSGSLVTVSTATQNYTADYVVCTVTLGNLKRNDVIFNPPLPAAYSQAIGRMGWGDFDKIMVRVPSFLGGNSTFSGDLLSNVQEFRVRDDSTVPRFVVTQTVNATDAASLGPVSAFIGFVGGTTRSNYFYTLSNAQAGDLLRNGLALSVQGFPGEKKKKRRKEKKKNVLQIDVCFLAVSAVSTTRWRNEVYSRGAYSFQTPGFLQDINTVRAPIPTFNSRVILAGEHLSTVQQSSVHGAYESGAYAVSQIPAAVIGLPDLIVVKDDCVSSVTIGGSYEFKITVRNAGVDTATGVSLVDRWPFAYYTLMSSLPSNCSVVSGSIVCSLGDLQPGASRVLSFRYTVASAAAAVTHVTNGVTVTSANGDSDPVTNDGNDTNLVSAAPTCSSTYGARCSSQTACCAPLSCLRHAQNCNSNVAEEYRCAIRGGTSLA